MSDVRPVTDSTFEAEVLRSELPVLVDLYADWCQPCKQLAPIVEEVARELSGKLRVAKVNIDENPLVAQSFRVQSIPMLVVVHQGRVVGDHMGLLDKPALLKLVERFLPADAAEIKPEDLAGLLQAGRVAVVDVRDSGAYGRYRIPGATHVPATDVINRKKEFLALDGRLRVLYARSTDEAKELAKQLRDAGVEVGFLAGGFLHWEAANLPVERGSS